MLDGPERSHGCNQYLNTMEDERLERIGRDEKPLGKRPRYRQPGGKIVGSADRKILHNAMTTRYRPNIRGILPFDNLLYKVFFIAANYVCIRCRFCSIFTGFS